MVKRSTISLSWCSNSSGSMITGTSTKFISQLIYGNLPLWLWQVLDLMKFWSCHQFLLPLPSVVPNVLYSFKLFVKIFMVACIVRTKISLRCSDCFHEFWFSGRQMLNLRTSVVRGHLKNLYRCFSTWFWCFCRRLSCLLEFFTEWFAGNYFKGMTTSGQ